MESARGRLSTEFPTYHRRSRCNVGLLLWGVSLSTHTFVVQGLGSREAELLSTPASKLIQSPSTQTTSAGRTGPVCPRLTEPSPAESMWGPVCCCQKGFVGQAMTVSRNRLKCT